MLIIRYFRNSNGNYTKMRLFSINQILLYLWLLSTGSFAFGQLSKTHYVPPIAVSYIDNSLPTDQYLYISTPSQQDVSYVIKPIGQDKSAYSYGTVSNDSPAVFGNSYPSFYAQTHDTPFVIPDNLASTVLADRGYVIEAERPVYVSVRFQSQAQAGAIVSKGSAALSKNFVFGSFVNNVPANNSIPFYSFFSVMATENDTDVEVQFPKSVAMLNYSGSYPVTITLQKNESYVGVLRSEDNTGNFDGLIGGSLTSDKDVVVVSGSATGTNGLGNGHDYGIDQLVGNEKAGTEFIFIRGESPSSYNETENILLVPLNANTTYSINGASPVTITGPYAIIEGDKFSGQGNMYVKTSGPVMSFQGVGADSGRADPEPNQGMFVVPALNCAAKGNIDNIPFINRIGSQTHQGGLGIVAEKGEDVRVNGALLNAGQDVIGNPAYVTYRISSLTSDLYKVESDGELYVSYYTYSGPSTSGAFYSGFQSAPEFVFDLDLTALGNCIQNNITLNATNVNTLDAFSWWYNPSADADPGQWQELTASGNTTALIPTQTGWYQLRGVLSCGTATNLNSQAVYVGNCPDDSDNDGVVDNLDLDKDNDGILDVNETGGDIALDFTNPTAVKLPSTTDKNIPLPPSYSVTGTFSYDASNGNNITWFNDGTFSSFIAAGVDSENTYSLSFSEPSNVVITLLDDFLSFHDNEYVTISTTGGNKSISLVNSQNTALVDTNYDDAYESDVDLYTSTQIRLRLNPNAPSPGQNVSLYGHNLSEVTITHALNNVSNNGGFNAKIRLENFAINSDENSSASDNVPDYMDLDSDGDGCSDVIEAGYEDPDNDGLAGISPVFYDPNAASSSADEFGRVVFTGYDFNATPLDNNNNAVYDFQEIGSAAVMSQNLSATNQVLCEGESTSFTFQSPDAENVFWEVDTDNDGVFESALPLGTATNSGADYSFTIDNITPSLNQASFRARINKSSYQCSTDSQVVTLTVNGAISKPNLDPLTVVCVGAVVSDLTVPNVLWYENASGGTALASNALLQHNKTYFASQIINGCESELRSETKVVVNDPIISTLSGKSSFCAGRSVTLTLDTDKILPSPDDFARINDLIYIENSAGAVSYDNGFYYVQSGIRAGVLPITWLDAKALGESIVGATMYIINSTTEEDAVYQGLQYMGLTGNDGIAFWLGLFQDSAASDYSEPTGGWYWVDGTPLTYQNWYVSEPNDWSSDAVDGEEDYAQFEFSNNLTQWNDMSLTDTAGQSYPLFEYKAQTEIEWFTYDGATYTAIAGATNSSQLVITPTQNTSYVVRVTTNGIVCESDPLTITIDPNPVANPVPNNQVEICVDDINGAILSADLRGDFDLTTTYTSILGPQNSSTHTVSFYTSLQDANNQTSSGLISTPSAFTNYSNPQTIYYRVTNTSTTCVSPVNQLTLRAQGLPPIITIDPVTACDDLVSGSDEDGIKTFDLTAQTSGIQTKLGSTTAYRISYHLTEQDAQDNLNSITSYTTTAADNLAKEIVVRIQDNTTKCVQLGNRMQLVVHKLPEIKQDTFVREQCDTDYDGIVEDDLSLYNVHFSVNHQNETFTYYTDPSLSASSKISTPNAYKNVEADGVTPIRNQTIYLKITTSDGCVRTSDPATGNPLTLKINVGASTIKASFFKNYYTCMEPGNSATPGFSTFDKGVFADLETSLIAAHPTFSNNAVTIQFYESEADAATKTNPIDKTVDYTNSTPNSQEIWVAVDATGLNKINCLGLKQIANLIVEPLPVLSPVVIPRQCDGDSPLDLDSQDESFPFDTSTLMSQLFAAQDPAKVTVTFYDENDVLIDTDNFPAVFNSPTQTIRAKVENKPSNVNPSCYLEAFIDFVVDDSPEVGPANIPELCDSSDGVIDGKASFDTSQLNANLLLGQSNMELNYLTRDGAGNETPLGDSLPNPFSTQTTTVIAQIYNPLNPTCALEKYIQFQVNENPTFELPEKQVYCLNLGPDIIYTTNPSATYNYSWTRNGTVLSQTTQNININQGGTYTVTASDPVTGCSASKTIEVSESELPLFDASDIQVFDLTGDGSNRIEVNTTDLGIGAYEFSLNYAPFQDSNVFVDVPPGIHTVSVRDKNGCGVVHLEVSVIGYPYFFTPNNDSKNDHWQLLGTSSVFQPSSFVYIFDRHGRLLAEISASGTGWDGTYNGRLLPADDYWFRAVLEDGRVFTGNFSLVR